MTDDDLRDSFGDELTEALRIRSRLRASTEVPAAVVSQVPASADPPAAGYRDAGCARWWRALSR